MSFTGKAMKPPDLAARPAAAARPLPAERAHAVQRPAQRTRPGLGAQLRQDGRELARSPALKTTGRDWASWQVAATMPTDCAGFGARLTLQTFAPYEAKTGLRGEALFDDLQLTSEGTQP